MNRGDHHLHREEKKTLSGYGDRELVLDELDELENMRSSRSRHVLWSSGTGAEGDAARSSPALRRDGGGTTNGVTTTAAAAAAAATFTTPITAPWPPSDEHSLITPTTKNATTTTKKKKTKKKKKQPASTPSALSTTTTKSVTSFHPKKAWGVNSAPRPKPPALRAEDRRIATVSSLSSSHSLGGGVGLYVSEADKLAMREEIMRAKSSTVEDVKSWKHNPTLKKWLAEKAAKSKQKRNKALETAREDFEWVHSRRQKEKAERVFHSHQHT